MNRETASQEDRPGWVRMLGFSDAARESPELAQMYRTMRANMGSRPRVYDSPTGDAPNIVRCHGLDPRGLALAFGLSGAVHWGERSLPWATRELINTVTSGANNCFY